MLCLLVLLILKLVLLQLLLITVYKRYLPFNQASQTVANLFQIQINER